MSSLRRDTEVVIDLLPLVDAVRDRLREDMISLNDADLASLLDQIQEYQPWSGESVTLLLRSALTAALIEAAQKETSRRLEDQR